MILMRLSSGVMESVRAAHEERKERARKDVRVRT
jgi:hypothetical protein